MTTFLSLYGGAAVTAVPSLYEPFGLVALEAMASGRPVVVSRVGGLMEIVDDASGFTVEPGDHLDLATRLAALLSDPELARAAGAAGGVAGPSSSAGPTSPVKPSNFTTRWQRGPARQNLQPTQSDNCLRRPARICASEC